ncbi:MAG: uroporphyrinogen-III C-methyltransferase [Bacteroidota bacterium]
MKTPKLTLVGAGPGDADLITLKGVKALQNADAVLYDALANPALLAHVPQNVPTIFVGKRKDHQAFSQEEINDLIIGMAHKYGNVVRLKGGDPFIFGRGYEEIEAARAHSIETEYIPGISSSVGVPGLEGIPVTHRGIAKSFYVVTATNSAGELTADIHAATKLDATVVILMGLGKLQEIVNVFEQAGKTDTGVAVIQNGSLPEHQIAVGTINNIVQIATEKNIGTPAVIVIGDTVKLHPAFQSAHEVVQTPVQ